MVISKLWSAFADNSNPRSFSAKARAKRMKHLRVILDGAGADYTVLDIGGTAGYWKAVGIPSNVSITVANLDGDKPPQGNMTFVSADATDLSQYQDKSFDLVFSNSVIEHVGDASARARMASEVRRVGVSFFVQTPNYWFPLEPHFFLPGFQWMPQSVRIWILTKYRPGWAKKKPDRARATELVVNTNLVKRDEFKSLFPEAEILDENVAGLTKSFMAVHRAERPEKASGFDLGQANIDLTDSTVRAGGPQVDIPS